MSTPTPKSPTPLMWISSIAIVLFSGVGIAAFMGWLPNSNGAASTVSTAPTPHAAVVAKPVHKTRIAVAHESPSRITTCTECGVIESIREVNSAGNAATGLGLVGGAVVGGLLGNQVGGGHGKDAATVVGAVGGAMAGNAIEKRTSTTKRYEITVRYDDGSRRVFKETNPPAWQSGDRVRIVDGAIRSNS